MNTCLLLVSSEYYMDEATVVDDFVSTSFRDCLAKFWGVALSADDTMYSTLSMMHEGISGLVDQHEFDDAGESVADVKFRSAYGEYQFSARYCELDDRLIGILGVMTTRDDAGKHFTDIYDIDDLSTLEQMLLIAVDRPVHPTGIPYDCQYWSVSVTELGMQVIQETADFAAANAPAGWDRVEA